MRFLAPAELPPITLWALFVITFPASSPLGARFAPIPNPDGSPAEVPKQQSGSAMKLSRTVAYGVQATLQLAQSNATSPVPCSQLASEGHMPERFLLQILRHLVTHGILHSTRGVDGGYNLERSPDEISLLELIEAIDGPLHSAVPVGEGVPLHYDAKLREALESITETARQQLSAIKLSDLLRPPASAGESATIPAENATESGRLEQPLRSDDWPSPVASAVGRGPHGGARGGNGSGAAAAGEIPEHHQ